MPAAQPPPSAPRSNLLSALTALADLRRKLMQLLPHDLPQFPPIPMRELPDSGRMSGEEIMREAEEIRRGLGPEESWEAPPEHVVRRAIDSYRKPAVMVEKYPSVLPSVSPPLLAALAAMLSLGGSSDPNVLRMRGLLPPNEEKTK